MVEAKERKAMCHQKANSAKSKPPCVIAMNRNSKLQKWILAYIIHLLEQKFYFYSKASVAISFIGHEPQGYYTSYGSEMAK